MQRGGNRVDLGLYRARRYQRQASMLSCEEVSSNVFGEQSFSERLVTPVPAMLPWSHLLRTLPRRLAPPVHLLNQRRADLAFAA